MSLIPPDRYIDLRSDTTTQPSEGMRRAIATAPVGEDLYSEDSAVNELERRSAEALGKESAVFVTTGTLGNLLAVKAQTQPGEEIILEERSHIYDGEQAGLAAVCGVLPRLIAGDENGMLQWEDLRPRIRPKSAHRAQTSLVCLENTHNMAGGTVLPQKECVELCRRSREQGLRSHLDGARLPNASVASRLSLAALAAPFDSVTMSFSKALGAPAGAVVAGSFDSMTRARRIRKMLGGGIHQPGMLAAGCLYGLDHNFSRLLRDHACARRLADGIAELPFLNVAPLPPPTNIVMVRLCDRSRTAGFVEALRARKILVMALEDGRIRLTTHLDVGEEQIEYTIDVLRSFADRGLSAY